MTDGIEIRYIALCTRVLPRYFKLRPYDDLYLIYAEVRFGHLDFCMGKSKVIYFSETIAAYDLKNVKNAFK